MSFSDRPILPPHFECLGRLHRMNVKDLIKMEQEELTTVIAATELLCGWLKGIQGLALIINREGN